MACDVSPVAMFVVDIFNFSVSINSINSGQSKSFDKVASFPHTFPMENRSTPVSLQ